MNDRYYGLTGNGETASLVGPDLALSWLSIPRFDGVPVFARALDPERGGALLLRLSDGDGRTISLSPSRQSYQGDTGVLLTVAEGEGWTAESLDYMPWGGRCLVREVRVSNLGRSPALIRLEPVLEPIRSAAFPVQMQHADGESLIRTAQGVLLTSVEPAGTVTVAPGGSASFRVHLGYGADEGESRMALDQAGAATAEAEMALWRGWIAPAQQPDPELPDRWLESYRRSLVVMKQLSYGPTGALLAAPTASFPAIPGGGDNWDYRYTWLRDGYYTAMSFDAAGLHQEAARFYDFAFSLQGEDGHWRQPLYTVDGADPVEFIAPDLKGPGGEVPIRFGNAASAQLQLDNEGNILHGLWFHYKTSGEIAALERHWEGVRRACAWTAANWNTMESGIWEIREYSGHWVHGKSLCYAAMEAGARIADILGHGEDAARWRAVAAAIRTDVVTKGFDPGRQAYLRHYGEGTPEPVTDISVLALVFYGLLEPDDPRILSTVALIEKEREEGGLFLYDGVCRWQDGAVPFYLPTLWLARYYLMAGRTAECDRLLETCLTCATDLGLMAEHFDGRDHSQWGNFPQAFSHEEMVRLVLERSRGASFHQWDQEGAAR